MKFAIATLTASVALLGITRFSGVVTTRPTLDILVIAVLAITTLAVFYLVDSRRKKGAMDFTQVYLITVVAKILVYGIFVVVVIIADRPNATPNAVFFLIGYFLFTILEVIFLYRGSLKQ
jgi:hypothetical protein